MNGPRLAATAVTLATIALAPAAGATKVRRPFEAAKTFNYGFDNNGSAAGCTDHACGSRCYDGHGGTDYPLTVGTDVLAGADGKVVATHNGCANYGGLGNTCGGGCGNYVKIQHADGHMTMFCHLQLGSLKVSTGQTVKCGQVVGRSASSGNSSGPHLHFAWRTSGNANIGSYSGQCSKYSSAWVDQGSYDGATSAKCECVAGSETCNGKDDDCDGQVDEGDVCEQQALLRGQAWLAQPRTTDIDGDGRADVCGRGAAGVWCHLSQGDSWADKGAVLGLSDDTGWDDPSNWGTLRMGDLDGDGRADLCARANAAVYCWKSDGAALATKIEGPEWSDDNGWAHPRFYSTLRLLDVDGDGKDDLCARAAKGIVCARSDGSGFEPSFDGPAWSDQASLGAARYYGTLRSGDVDGDGRQDLCMRVQEGMDCWLSNGTGFPTQVLGPAWSDASGWGDMKYWSTIRLADVDGDGRSDLCARDSEALRCHLSKGDAFGEAIVVAPLSDAVGWGDESNYATLRTGDVTGDGAEDLCIRANAKVICYHFTGSEFASFDGPAWSDDDGWNNPEHFHTLQLGDMNGDGKDDLCARQAAGWVCLPSTGSGFGAPVELSEFTNAGGWSKEPYYPTVVLGGPSCSADTEICNGKDDDCDGEVDEGACTGPGSGGAGSSWGAGGSVSGGTSGSAAAGGAAGANGEAPEDSSGAGAGCGCRLAGRPHPHGAALLLVPAVLLWRRRRLRRRSVTGRPRNAPARSHPSAAARARPARTECRLPYSSCRAKTERRSALARR